MKKETIRAQGHSNVTARHRTTLEITMEDHLTPRGDCIVAVGADRGLRDFSEDFRQALKSGETLLLIRMSCCGLVEEVRAYGHPDLTLEDPEEMVVRKSEYTCPRTLAVRADRAAVDLGRDFVRKLSEGNPVDIVLEIVETD